MFARLSLCECLALQKHYARKIMHAIVLVYDILHMTYYIPHYILHSLSEPGELSQWLCHDDSTIKIVMIIIIIIIVNCLYIVVATPFVDDFYISLLLVHVVQLHDRQ